MKNSTGKEPVQIELWVAFSGGRWQFFEITEEGVREVEHAGAALTVKRHRPGSRPSRSS